MKKIISIILTLAIMISAFPVIANEAVSTKNESAEEIGLLTALGILNEDEINLYNKNFEVTRAAFVRIVNRLYNSDMSIDIELPFWDVNRDNEYYRDIALAYSYGIIDGTPGDAFRPFDVIKYNEALKIIGVMLGYKEYALVSGGYPTGYLAAAQIGNYALTGSFNADALTFKPAVSLIFKALSAPMVIYEGESEKTILDYRFNIEKTTGTVNANDITALAYGGNYIPNALKINGEFYEFTNPEYREFLGYNVNCYYDVSSLEIMYICKDKNQSLTVNAKDFEKNYGTYISYLDGTKEKRADISDTTVFIYNGKTIDYETEYKKMFESFTLGTIECIDNTNDGVFDVVKVLSYENFVVKLTDEEDMTVYGKYNDAPLVLSEDVSYTIADAYGKVYAFSDIDENAVLMAAASFDKEYVNVIFANDITEGVISSVDTAENKVVINNKEYEISKELLSSEVKLLAGTTGIFYLNAEEEIAHYENAEIASVNVGLMSRCTLNEDDDSILIAVMVQDSDDSLKYRLNKPVMIDGEAYKESTKILNLLNPERKSSIATVIRYEVNEEGLINEIDTETLGASESLKDTLVKRWSTADAKLSYKKNETGAMSTRFVIGSAPLFAVSETEATVEAYDPMDVLSDDQSCSMDIYMIGNKSVKAVATVMSKDDLSSGAGQAAPIGEWFCVFDSANEQYDEETGEVRGVMTYYNGTAKKTAYIESENMYLVKDLTRGDAFLIQTNAKNYLEPGKVAGANNIVKIYDYETDTLNRDLTIFDDYSNQDALRLPNATRYYIYYGKVYTKADSYLRVGGKNINYDNLTLKEKDSKLTIRSTYQSYYGGAIYEVDGNTLIVSTPSFAAIRDYDTYGDINKADTIIAHTEYGHDRRNCYFRH